MNRFKQLNQTYFTETIVPLFIKYLGFPEQDAKELGNGLYVAHEGFLTRVEEYNQADNIKLERAYSLLVENYRENYFIKADDYFNTILGFYRVLEQSNNMYALGDIIGYRNGIWEFNGDAELKDGAVNYDLTFNMIEEYVGLGGILDLDISNWNYSDDTILYMTTRNFIEDHLDGMTNDHQRLMNTLVKLYITTLPLLRQRHGGDTTIRSLEAMRELKWNLLPYNESMIGAGGCMRTGCIGLYFFGSGNRQKLVELAVDISCITHNSAISILASVTTALFTAYALECVDVKEWASRLVTFLETEIVVNYLRRSRPNIVVFFNRDSILYIQKWRDYIRLRFSGTEPKVGLHQFTSPVARFRYLAENFSKNDPTFPGGTADSCVIMAYDAILSSESKLEKFTIYSCIHPGDSDTVGAIAGGWYGAMYSNKYLNASTAARSNFLIEYLSKQSNLYAKSNGEYEPIISLDVFPILYYNLLWEMYNQATENY